MANADDLPFTLPTFDTSGFSVKSLSLKAEQAMWPNAIRLRAVMCVRDRDTGEQTELVTQEDVLLSALDVGGRDFLIHLARNLLVRGLAHELDETLLVDGKRFIDPHASERKESDDDGDADGANELA